MEREARMAVDTWAMAAECARAVETSENPTRRAVLRALQKLWIVLGEKERLLSEQEVKRRHCRRPAPTRSAARDAMGSTSGCRGDERIKAGPMRQHGVRLLPGARRGARATAVGSTSESRLLPVGQRGARLPAVPCDDKGKGDGDESFNQAAAVCFRARYQRRGVPHHYRDPAPRIEVMHGYWCWAVFGMGEVVVLAQSNYTGQPLWSP